LLKFWGETAGQIVTSIQTVKLIGVGSLAFFAIPLNCGHRVKETQAVITALTVGAPGR